MRRPKNQCNAIFGYRLRLTKDAIALVKEKEFTLTILSLSQQ